MKVFVTSVISSIPQTFDMHLVEKEIGMRTTFATALYLNF